MSRHENQLTLVVLALLAIVGLALAWDKGKLPQRDSAAVEEIANAGIAPDLALYRDVIREVRAGRNYYEVAGEKIPAYGFPIGSPLNWRLPTYAWVLSQLPNKCWIQAVLLLLAIGGMWLGFVAACRHGGVGQAGLTTFLLFGVLRWTFDGQAYLAQEVWAATLLVVSLSTHQLGQNSNAWRAIAVIAGLFALFFRELALPYCGIACLVAAWNRRWLETAAWSAGIALFFAFFAWHVGQVKAQLAGLEVAAAASSGLGQWLKFGGLDFVLLTTRMNSLLFAAPSCLLWIYLLVALVGLSRCEDDSSHLVCLAALTYVMAFAFVGRPENFYWGLMPAPLLAWGAASGPLAILDRWRTPSIA